MNKKWIPAIVIVAVIAIVLSIFFLIPNKSGAAKACEALVAEIGTVTLQSEEKIVAAENAYGALSAEEKKQIDDSAATLQKARETYDRLVKEKEEADREAAIKERVDNVESLISKIGSVTLNSKAAIQAARTAYDALLVEDRSRVTNYNVLTAAEATYKTLKTAESQEIIKQYKSKFKIETDEVENITWYMPKNMPYYIDTRSYIIPYIGVKHGIPWVCIRYNYTGDDWVFWESLKIVADGETFVKYVGAFDTVRDNEYGAVWEYYDEVVDENASLDAYSLQMLQKIANSSKTIIRFQGDDYCYDLTVSAKDKAMIKDVLAMYAALSY